MRIQRHPIIIVLFILVVFIFFLGTLMVVVQRYLGHSRSFMVAQRIGVIPITGVITDSQLIVDQLVTFRKDRKIKAIILRIDSPGGAVGPSQEIYREVRRTNKEKTIIASLGGVAASGGYYAASAAEKIVSNPGTITGSIGVIMEFVRIEDLLDKLGIGFEVVKSGEFKDVGSPHRQMTEKERVLLQELITDVKDQFVQAVAEGRGLTTEKVLEFADGRIFSGARAKSMGLVDRLGNFQDAVNLAKEISHIEGEVTLVYPERQRLSIWELFAKSTVSKLVGLLQERLGGRLTYRWYDTGKSFLSLPEKSRLVENPEP
jgi:protease-4